LPENLIFQKQDIVLNASDLNRAIWNPGGEAQDKRKNQGIQAEA